MSEISLFLSSKVSPKFNGLDRDDFSIGDLRLFLKTEFEKENFLGKQLISLVMNEEGFESSFNLDAFDTCLEAVKASDLIVILYNGDAGWAPNKDPNTNGICHEEFILAVQEHPSMTFGINISKYFETIKYTKDQTIRNQKFKEDIESYYRFTEFSNVKTVADLKDSIKRLLLGYISKSIKLAFIAKKELDSGNTTFGKTLDWSKLSYAQRNYELKLILKNTFKDIFSKVICEFHAIPDHLSIPDARNYLGRPFLNEHLKISSTTLNKGVIHFIAIIGNATETQCKNIVGYPDLTLIKTSFGYYLWEQTIQIQLFVCSKCINPTVVKTRKQQVLNWVKSSKEEFKIHLRAEERFKILKSIEHAYKATK